MGAYLRGTNIGEYGKLNQVCLLTLKKNVFLLWQK